MEHPAYKVIGSLGTLITAATSIRFDQTSNLAVNIFLLLSATYASIYFTLDAWRAVNYRTHSFDPSTEKGKKRIVEYLCKQLSCPGQVAIFSRDLTWATSNSEAEKTLIKKAEKGELTIFVKDPPAITDKLKAAKAKIRQYTAKGFNPKSRFTILKYQNSGTRVMIGAPQDENHYIKHYGSDDFEVVDLANDFIALLETKSRPL